MNGLRGLTVLVTRPLPEGQVLCDKIDAAGGKAIYCPAIEIKPPCDIALLKEQLAALKQYDWLIFISPQAVYQTADLLFAISPDFPSSVRLAAVGKGTARVLQQMHFPEPIFPDQDENSEGLLELRAFQKSEIKNKKVGLIRGEGGRTLLVDTLIQRGAMLTDIVAYRRSLPIDYPTETIYLLNARKIDIIVGTSADIIRNIKIRLGKRDSEWEILSAIPLLVVSARLVDYAHELGFKKTILAKNAGHDAIMTMLAQEKDTLCQMKQKQ